MDNLVTSLSKQNNAIKKIQQSLRKINKHEPDATKRISILNTEISIVDRNLNKLSLEPSLKAEIENSISEAKSEIPHLEQIAKKEFGNNLNNILQKNGFVLEGNYPKLRTSVYTIIIDMLRNKAELYYGPEIEKVETCKPIADDVASKLLNHYNELNQKEFSNETFLKNLYDAYSMCLLMNNKKIGDKVPIPDVLYSYAFIIQNKNFKQNPLKKYYHEYNRVSLSYDLHKLKERKIDNMELTLVTAKRAETNNKLDFLWLPSSNEKGIGQSISSIKFSKVE